MGVSAGDLGYGFVSLALASAFVSSVSFFASLRAEEPTAKRWRQFGRVGFGVHAASVLGVLAVLLALLFSHNYAYHYVWSHSSNELPNHFVLACLWEGQEGSFLIWMVWHVLLGLVVLWRGGRWVPGVLAVVASVQAILATMILGVQLTYPVVAGVLGLLLVALATGVLLQQRQENRTVAAFALAATGLALVNLLRDQSGFISAGDWAPGFALQGLFLLAFAGYVAWLQTGAQKLAFLRLVPVTALWGIAVAIAAWRVDVWQVGSSPFLTLREALPNDRIWAENPAFVPTNGTGLNPLLQNYWMVIHPPTLFLGFAASLIPFAYAVAALLQRDYLAWAKPTQPWALLSGLVLGVGIIMGAYWAYVTLNFGGYWNWDPVENASFVPWLVGVAGLHALLNWRTGRANLRTALLLLIATFILVLYSTFLTRSGILGNNSVHSFTDLGLSGQLLVLLLVYFGGVILLLIDRWPQLPRSKPTVNQRGAKEFWLFSGAVLLTAAGGVIILLTSLPVFNKIFGTNIAPPAEVPYFYYKFTVWFGIGFAVLSGLAQYYFWTRHRGEALAKAVFRPFVLALGSAVGVMVALYFFNWEFGFDPKYRATLEEVRATGSGFDIAANYAGYAVLFLADEFLLAAGLFVVLANADLATRLARRASSHWLRMGGALAHIGFGLMLVGILFSSGYDTVVTQNQNPFEFDATFTDQARQDNVRLLLNQPRKLKHHTVTYLGRNQPRGPVRDAEVIHREGGFIKVVFKDALGDRYQFAITEKPFVTNGTLDEEQLQAFVQTEYPYQFAELVNGRTIFSIEFVPLDTAFGQPNLARRFMVFPETELDQQNNLTPHPDRRIGLTSDIYVHVAGLQEDEEYRAIPDSFLLQPQTDTVRLPSGIAFSLDSVVPVPVQEIGPYRNFQAGIRAALTVTHAGRQFKTAPMLLFTPRGDKVYAYTRLNALGMVFAATGFDLVNNRPQITIRLAQRNESVIINALRKPYINLLWLGTFFLAAGFGLALVRRIRESTR